MSEPDRVGAYAVIREIGRGGMGAVYLAERADGQFEFMVALALVRLEQGQARANLTRLVALYEAWGRPEKVAAYR